MSKHLIQDYKLSPHNMDKNDVMNHYQTTPKGLTNEEASHRQQHYGTNELEEGEKETLLELFIKQFQDTLIIILIIAAFISGLVLNDYTDASLIAVILVLNAVFGVYQEWRADQAIEALKQMISHSCVVIRDNKEIEIITNDLVPGDIILFSQGDRIPADGRIIEVKNLRIDEAQLTGESVEISKSSVSKVAINSPLGDRINSIFMGTYVTFGKGKAVVTHIGMTSEMGKIANEVSSISREPTPTQMKLEAFGKKLGVIIVGIMIFIIFYGVLIAKLELSLMIETAVSLAVAAIPEGLVIVITLALSLGVIRMARQNAIVKKLPAVESLGSVTTICTDKTGTLTLNQMTVQKVVEFDHELDSKYNGKPPNANNQGNKKYNPNFTNALFLCNNSKLSDDQNFGDPLELALLRLTDSIDIDRITETKRYNRLDEIPFESEKKRMTVIVEEIETEKKFAYTKGAPEVLLEIASLVDLGNGPVELTDEIRRNIQSIIDDLTSQALRVLGFGYNELTTSTYNIYDFESDLVLNGLVGMIDPSKDGVKEAVVACHTAGIRVIMVTGDHKNTAVAIGKTIGIFTEGDKIVEGIELDNMSNYQLEEEIKNISIFARISPQHKLRIVRALKSNGEIVAMTGDGVNDAPALKGADVGIAMGSGTDVTKETAEMILEDDNFTTIVSAVEEGRVIYDNMTKFIRYMLSSNLAEIVVIFLSIVITRSPALVATQILWINLVTDGAPALALGVDPSSKGIMNRPPRDPKEKILTRDRSMHILLFGGFMSIITLGSYILFLETNIFGTLGNSAKASTIAFAILSLSQLMHALNVREDRASILNSGFFKNKVLLFVVAITIILQVIVIQGDVLFSNILNSDVSTFGDLFKTVPLSQFEWFYVAIISLSLIAFSEILKIIKRNTKFVNIC